MPIILWRAESAKVRELIKMLDAIPHNTFKSHFVTSMNTLGPGFGKTAKEQNAKLMAIKF